MNKAAAQRIDAERMAERDEARARAKRIVLDLINESSASELGAWLMGPRQFQLAVVARLDNWQ